MKYPEYDSPFEIVMSDITTQMARDIDDMCLKAVQRIGINVNEETFVKALKQDAERYREAFSRGEETGYKKRDEEIVRCKDCKNLRYTNSHWFCKWLNMCVDDDWFCADGERAET